MAGSPQIKITKLIDSENPLIEASVNTRGSKGAQVVEIVDASGNQVVDFGQAEATGYNGGPVTVGTSAVELTFTGTTQSIAIKSAKANTGTIWFGGATIDNTGANAVGDLAPGQSVTIDLDDTSAALYAVSDTAAQTVYKLALT